MSNHFFSFRSFRSQTAAMYGGIVVILAIALTTAFGAMLSSQVRADKSLALKVIAQNAARTLATGLHERNLAVKALASSDMWAEGLGSKAVRATLHRFQAAGTNRSWVGVADTDGVVRNSTGDLLLGQSVAARPWFQEGLNGNHVGDVHGAKLLASLLPPGPRGEPLRFVDFSAPVKVHGKVIGVVGLHGSWEWARNVVESMLPANSAEMGLELYIFDKAGNVIFAPGNIADRAAAQQRIPAASPGSVSVIDWDDHVPYLTAMTALPTYAGPSDLGWTVVAREPTRLAFASARTIAQSALAIGVVAALLGSLMAWLASGTLSRPLSRIARAARDVEQGVAGAQIPMHHSSTEMERLSTALNGMTNQLLANNVELEKRVAERTAALETAMGRLEEANVELENLARHDPLTGLLNRRAFDERMEQALASAKRGGFPLSLLIVDADHFKSVNDRFGHESGDDVLKMIARLLQERLRETDCVARMGGEEFAVLLPNTDRVGALQVATDLVSRAAATEIPGVGVVTLSVGVATTAYAADARSQLMRTADKALYEAKSGGRNRAFQYPALSRAA